MQKCCFIIFAHSNLHDIDDINDIIDNINHFHKNADFMILHPTMNHEKIRLNSPLKAAPPLITILMKMPRSTEQSFSSMGFVFPFTLTPKPAEPVSFSAISNVNS